MKIILWGHKLGTHTHAYVHYGFYRAAKKLGYETYWFDDNDDVDNFNFSNSIFITEHQVFSKMPIRSDCVYFNHNVDLPFVLSNRDTEDRINHPNYFNFVHFADRWGSDFSVGWPKEQELVKINDHHFYHSKSKTITTIWATDLLPEEIEKIEPVPFDEQKQMIYYVGSKQGINIDLFSNVCKRHGKQFLNVGGYTGVNSLYTGNAPDINQNIGLIRESYMSVDIRDAPHLKMGRYYPCRIFKNISYGKWVGSNCEAIQDLFGDYITCSSDLDNLFDKTVEDYKNCSYSKMKEAMSFIKDKHTYINRLNDMLSILK